MNSHPRLCERKRNRPAPDLRNPPRKGRSHSRVFRRPLLLCFGPLRKGLVLVVDWPALALMSPSSWHRGERIIIFIPRLTTFSPTNWCRGEASMRGPGLSIPWKMPTLMPKTKWGLEKAHRSSICLSSTNPRILDQAHPETIMVGMEICVQARHPSELVTKCTRDSIRMGDGIQLLSKASLFPPTRKKSSSLSFLMTAKRRPIFHVLVSAPCRIIMANKHANRTIDGPCLDETLTSDRKDAYCESLRHESELATSMVCPKAIAIRADLSSWQELIRAIFIGSTEMLTKVATLSS